MIDINSGWLFAGGAAAGSLVASFWSHIQNIYQQLASRIIMTITLSGYQAEAMQCYLKSQFSASRWGPRAYLGWMLYVRSKRRVQLVPMEVSPPAGRLYWRGWRPLWMYRTPPRGRDLEEGVTANDYDQESVGVSFLRGMFKPDDLVIEASTWFNQQVVENFEANGRRHYIKHIFGSAGKMHLQGRRHNTPAGVPSSNTDIRGCLQYRPLLWSFSELGPDRAVGVSAVDALSLSDDAMELVEEAQRWKTSESWYKSHGFPWRRGWLLHGPPGTGKTALTRAIAEDLDLPVFVFDLASLFNNELQQEWSKMLAEVPCMALIEDIDAVFDKRQNISGRDRQDLTFDCFLNCLDGVERADGLFLVVTTNRLDKIDAALGIPDATGRSTRPGRIDRILELHALDRGGRLKIAQRTLSERSDLWSELIHEGEGDTGAQFQERCAQKALRLHFGEDTDCIPAEPRELFVARR